MSYRYDANARYAKSHEWARMEGKIAVIGMSATTPSTCCPMSSTSSCRRWAIR